MNGKNPLLSKTLWFGLLVTMAGTMGRFYPPVTDFIKHHPNGLSEIFGAAVIALRLVTKDKIILSDDTTGPKV